MTLRRLFWMAAGKRQDDWGHTSSLLAMLHNVHCTRSCDLAKPSAFDPTRPRRAPRPLTKQEFRMLAMGMAGRPAPAAAAADGKIGN